MNDVLKKIGTIGIIPVVKIGDAKDAVPLVKALYEGGLPYVEAAFRTDAAEEAIRAIAKAYPEILVGAGMVLMTEQVDKVVTAGATFIASPGLNPKVVKYCVEKGVLVTPDVSNASDIEQAIELGPDVVKFFPTEQAGGLAMIKALAAPYVKMEFVPTGGINAKNLNEYLAYNKILACGGSWVIEPELISAGEFDKIRDMTREMVRTMLGFEFGHIGIDTKDATEVGKLTDAFNDIFGFAKKEGSSSFFAGTTIEIMKYKGFGNHGHFSVNTNSLPGAISYFESRGVEFDPDSVKHDDKGSMTIVYFKRNFCGLRVYLAQKKR